MKILKMIGLVVAAHAVVLLFGFVLPGCRSTVRTSPSSTDSNADAASRVEMARARTGGATQTGAAHQTTPAALPPTDYGYMAPPVGGPVSASTMSSTPDAYVTPTRPTTQAYAPNAESTTDVVPATTYTVVSGDSPWKIAKKYGITTKALTDANNLSENPKLKIGQKLIIPAKTVTKTTTTATADTITYKVKANDTLDTIARRYNTTADEIRSLNKLSKNTLNIGQELVLPATSTTTYGSVDSYAPAPSSSSSSATVSGTTITHTVKQGESLDVIARYYGASVREIGLTNHISNPKSLQIGQKLKITSATKNIPGTETPATVTTTPAATTPASGTTTPSYQQPTSSPVSPVSPVITPSGTDPFTSGTEAPPPVFIEESNPIITPQG